MPLESCAWIIGYIDPKSTYHNIYRIQDSKRDIVQDDKGTRRTWNGFHMQTSRCKVRGLGFKTVGSVCCSAISFTDNEVTDASVWKINLIIFYKLTYQFCFQRIDPLAHLHPHSFLCSYYEENLSSYNSNLSDAAFLQVEVEKKNQNQWKLIWNEKWVCLKLSWGWVGITLQTLQSGDTCEEWHGSKHLQSIYFQSGDTLCEVLIYHE